MMMLDARDGKASAEGQQNGQRKPKTQPVPQDAGDLGREDLPF